MQIKSLGHVVLKVSDLARAEAFYNGVLGLPVMARLREDVNMTFFSLGNHHDFAVMEVGAAGVGEGSGPGPGLHHVAFKIGDSLDELREARAVLTDAGVKTSPIDHDVTKSLYLRDPDGNGVELYIDASDAWRAEPQRITYGAPLEL